MDKQTDAGDNNNSSAEETGLEMKNDFTYCCEIIPKSISWCNYPGSIYFLDLSCKPVNMALIMSVTSMLNKVNFAYMQAIKECAMLKPSCKFGELVHNSYQIIVLINSSDTHILNHVGKAQSGPYAIITWEHVMSWLSCKFDEYKGESTHMSLRRMHECGQFDFMNSTTQGCATFLISCRFGKLTYHSY